MSVEIKQINLLKKFECLGGDCPDTCCKGWEMQLDSAHEKLYEEKAPELLGCISKGVQGMVMKRDENTDYCIKFEDGLCGIQKKHGVDFLGDACHFYPRATRGLGEKKLMTATISCPEIMRLALEMEDPFGFSTTNIERLPVKIKNYIADTELPETEAIAVFETFLNFAGDENLSAERIMFGLVTTANSLENIEKKNWEGAARFYLRTIESRLTPAEGDENDNLYLVQTLSALIFASPKGALPRLKETIDDITEMLGVEIDWQNLNIIQNKTGSYAESLKKYQQNPALQQVMKRWIGAQIMESLFPFAGLGHKPSERALIIAIRFAIARLGLIALNGKRLATNENITRVFQSLSRFLDHLYEPELSLNLFEQFGWSREARLRAAIGDAL